MAQPTAPQRPPSDASYHQRVDYRVFHLAAQPKRCLCEHSEMMLSRQAHTMYRWQAMVDPLAVVHPRLMLVILELRPVLTLPTPPPWSYSSGKFWSNCDRCREGASGLATTTHTGWH